MLLANKQMQPEPIDAPPINGTLQANSPHSPHSPHSPSESPTPSKAQDLISTSEKDNSTWQLDWNRTVRQELNLPEGYDRVTVLIIKWENDIDELKTEKEVKELQNLFQDDFHYHTEICELDDRKNVQLQLNSTVIRFIQNYDSRSSLLIVYYTGHTALDTKRDVAVWNANSRGPKFDRADDRFPAEARWDKAQSYLKEDARGDVVAIMDTCFASDQIKGNHGGEPRSFELLAAAGHGRQTTGPGPKSFTTAMIRALRDLLKECPGQAFTVRQLCERINLQPERRNNQSQVWSILRQYSRNIAFGPQVDLETAKRPEDDPARTRAMLTLVLPLTVETLDDDQRKALARSLSKAVKGTEYIKRIDWSSLERIDSARWARKWREITIARKKDLRDKAATMRHDEAKASVQTPSGVKSPQPQPTESRNPGLSRSTKRRLSIETATAPEEHSKRRIHQASEVITTTDSRGQCLTPVTEPDQD